MKLKTRLVIFVAFFLVSLLLLSQIPGTEKAHWYSLVPPILAVGLAFATHNIYLSLGLAVLVGGPLAVGSIGQGIALSAGKARDSLMDPINIQILVFASFVLIMIGVIQDAGGFRALAEKLAHYAKTKKSTKLMTFLLGIAVFIDDYASTMIVGSSMKPLSDRVGISRAKLAFLVDATSAPIAGLAVVSTWIGYEVGLFEEVSKTLSLGQSGYAMFFDAISFRFYCVFMLMFILFNILTGLDFGPMRKAESESQPHQEIKTPQDTVPGSFIWIALLPLISLLGFLFVSLWYDGKGPELLAAGGSLLSLNYWRDVLSQAQNNILILAKSATLGLFISLGLSVFLAKTPFGKLGSALFAGGKKALLPVTILVLAWSLKSICTELNTGEFLAHVLGDVIRPSLFPLCLFIVAALIAISTGTSWGTMAILIPTAIPLAFHLDGGTYGLITMISLGAILDGAIMGDHCSPISDTTILSSMSTECNLMEHVRTQLPYSLLIGLVAILCGYLPAGLGQSWYVTTGLGFGFLALLFQFMKYRRGKNLW
jgi:Na+/H+ antiporter NhaC